MPDLILKNRNVPGGQQQTPLARRSVADPVMLPLWATVELPPLAPSQWNEVTEPHPIPFIATRRPTPTGVATARRGSSGFVRFVRGVLLFTIVLLAAVWGATFAFPALLHYTIIADTAQLASNIYYTLWGVLYAAGIFALMVYAQRDAIISFVGANPLLSTSVGVSGLLYLTLLGLTLKGRRRGQ